MKRVALKLISQIVLETPSADIKRMSRDFEKLELKLVSLKSHRTFNETCLNVYM